jgi:hypothetical protein
LSIRPPFGYNELQPLQRGDRVLLPHGSTPGFCRGTNAIALSWSEFVPAARDYPLVFAGGSTRRDGAGEEESVSYAPVAVLGLADAQNLYVNEQGDWEPGAYVPAFVRRYPFCIARVAVGATQQPERIVCVDKAYLDPHGIALHDAAGAPTPRWQAYEKLLEEYEADIELTTRMCAVLAELGLFSTFQFQVLQGSDATFTMQGMHRIDEKKLSDLAPASHKMLVENGLMGRIYAHINSLENFGRLYSRAVARAEREANRKREGHQR